MQPEAADVRREIVCAGDGEAGRRRVVQPELLERDQDVAVVMSVCGDECVNVSKINIIYGVSSLSIWPFAILRGAV